MASGGAEKFKAASALCEKGEAAAIANLLSKMPAMGNWIDAAGRSLLMLAIESKQPSCALALKMVVVRIDGRGASQRARLRGHRGSHRRV